MNVVLWESTIRAYKEASAVTLHLDGVGGHLIMRIGLLNSCSQKPETLFWQSRSVGSKTAKGTFESVVKAFDRKPMENLGSDFHFNEKEFFGKLVAVVGDGARELGLSAKNPGRGENLLTYLTKRKEQLCGTGEANTCESLVGYWCS